MAFSVDVVDQNNQKSSYCVIDQNPTRESIPRRLQAKHHFLTSVPQLRHSFGLKKTRAIKEKIKMFYDDCFSSRNLRLLLRKKIESKLRAKDSKERKSMNQSANRDKLCLKKSKIILLYKDSRFVDKQTISTREK